MKRNDVTVSYINENGQEVRVSVAELNIHLENDQILTISSSLRQSEKGIAISDHSVNDENRREYSVLQVTPCACNVIEVSASKEHCKS